MNTSPRDGRSRFGDRPEYASTGGFIFPARFYHRPGAGTSILLVAGAVHLALALASWIWG